MSNFNINILILSFLFYTVNHKILVQCVLVSHRISITLVFYGLSIGATNIAGDKYLNFILVSLVEIPACFLNWLVMESMPRRISLSCMFVLSGLTCVLYNLTPESEYAIILCLTSNN